MGNLVEKAKDLGTTISNITKSLGPFIISQSDKASEEFAKHKGRLASVEVLKEVLINEAKILQSTKEELLKRYIDSDNIGRIRIKRDIREIDESFRALNLGQKALTYIPDTDEAQCKQNDSIDKKEISDSWLDRFNELAKLRHEPWREELLARALAKESSSPGSVSPRALWLIGTLEEKLFHAFSVLLDTSAFISSGPMIPNGKSNAVDLVVSNCILGDDIKIGSLVFMLSDVNLIGDTLSTQRTIKQGNTFHANYGSEKFSIECKTVNFQADGIIYTALGSSIAAFYDAKQNELGSIIFQDWLGTLNKEQFEVTKIS